MPAKIGGFCSAPGCGKPFYCKGYCIQHYERWRKHGDVSVNLALGRWKPNAELRTASGQRAMDLPVRPGYERLRDQILSRLITTNGNCWEWQGALSPQGYGRFTPATGSPVSTSLPHRALFASLVEAPASSLHLDHLCRNPPCCNPEHLEQVTPRENSLRGESFAAQHARKTECVRGHAFDAENTLWEPTGARRCKKCRRMHYDLRNEQRRIEREQRQLSRRR